MINALFNPIGRKRIALFEWFCYAIMGIIFLWTIAVIILICLGIHLDPSNG